MGRLFNILFFLCLFLVGNTYSTESYAMIQDTEIDTGFPVEVVQAKVGELTLLIKASHYNAVLNFGAHFSIVSDNGTYIQSSVNTLSVSFDLPKGDYKVIVYSSTFFQTLYITI